MGSAAFCGDEKIVVEAEEGAGLLGERRGFVGDGFDAEHRGMIMDYRGLDCCWLGRNDSVCEL